MGPTDAGSCTHPWGVSRGRCAELATCRTSARDSDTALVHCCHLTSLRIRAGRSRVRVQVSFTTCAMTRDDARELVACTNRDGFAVAVDLKHPRAGRVVGQEARHIIPPLRVGWLSIWSFSSASRSGIEDPSFGRWTVRPGTGGWPGVTTGRPRGDPHAADCGARVTAGMSAQRRRVSTITKPRRTR